MKSIAKISNFASKYIGIIIIVLSIIAFCFPPTFSWATNYTSLLLGIAMFGMGLTIKLDDFKIVFTRPKAGAQRTARRPRPLRRSPRG